MLFRGTRPPRKQESPPGDREGFRFVYLNPSRLRRQDKEDETKEEGIRRRCMRDRCGCPSSIVRRSLLLHGDHSIATLEDLDKGVSDKRKTSLQRGVQEPHRRSRGAPLLEADALAGRNPLKRSSSVRERRRGFRTKAGISAVWRKSPLRMLAGIGSSASSRSCRSARP